MKDAGDTVNHVNLRQFREDRFLEMGRNKKESFIFTLIMCVLMVLGMSIYNLLLLNGFSNSFFKDLVIGYVPAFLVALVLDVFVVGKLAKSVAHKFIKPADPMFKRVMLISFCMVSSMVLLMSFYGAVVHVGFTADLFHAYLKSVLQNFICALPLQFLIVGPLTRIIFMRFYPPVAVPTT